MENKSIQQSSYEYNAKKYYLRRFKTFIKQLCCEHYYGLGIISPFSNTEGKKTTIYTCEKCGKKIARYI